MSARIGAIASQPKLPREQATSVDGLTTIPISANWRLPESRQAHLLVHDLGDQLDEITDAFIARLVDRSSNESAVGLAPEIANIPGSRRPIRVLHRFQAGHCSTTDVVLHAEGDDLYSVFSSKPRTMLSLLNFGLRGALLVAGVVGLLWMYLSVSGARISWIKDYADRHAAITYNESRVPFMTDRLSRGGYWVNWEAINHAVNNDPVISNAVWSALNYELEMMSQRGDINALGGQMQMMKIRGFSGDLYQFLASDQLSTMFGDNYFIWHNSVPLVQHVNIAGMKADQVIDGEYVWQTLEVNDLGPLYDFFYLGGEGGEKLTEVFEANTHHVPAWSIATLAKNDPRTAMFNIGLPITVSAGLVGFFVWRAPRSWLRFPCRLLRWLTPEDFNARAIARNAWVEREFSKTLAEFGVSRASITELNGVANHG